MARRGVSTKPNPISVPEDHITRKDLENLHKMFRDLQDQINANNHVLGSQTDQVPNIAKKDDVVATNTANGVTIGLHDGKKVNPVAVKTLTGTITAAQHGNLAGGSLHSAVVSAGASGFMTGADKAKLDDITAVGAAANILNATAHYTSGTVVVQARQAGVTAALAVRTSGATYTATEQTMLQEAHNMARTLAVALRTHGLIT